MAVEDTGSGTQLVRVRCWPQCYTSGWVMLTTTMSASVLAALTSSYRLAGAFGVIGTAIAWRLVRECGATTGTILRGMRTSGLLPKRKAAAVLQPNEERV